MTNEELASLLGLIGSPAYEASTKLKLIKQQQQNAHQVVLKQKEIELAEAQAKLPPPNYDRKLAAALIAVSLTAALESIALTLIVLSLVRGAL